MSLETPHDASGLALERLLFFSDAVIAIAITLLAIELRLPAGEDVTNERLLQMLGDLGPRFLAFAISFAVIGIYWVAHHRMFRMIAAFDSGLVFWNMLFLFCVATLPFLTSILGEHGNLAAATSLYALGLALMGFASSLVWVHAVRRHLLTPGTTPAVARYITWRALTVPVIFLCSIPLAWVAPHGAQLSWMLIMPALRLLTRRMKVADLGL